MRGPSWADWPAGAVMQRRPGTSGLFALPAMTDFVLTPHLPLNPLQYTL